MNLKTETGRSMVEMLGTLAIIGVLSIGGIAGYSYGMDKYRCNQTMRDISLRTVDLLTQASQGHSTLSLAEWENEESVYDFSNPTHAEGGVIKFDIGATNKVPKSVCGMIFDGLSNTATQIDINGSVATSKDSCGEDNTMTFYFAGGGSGTTDTGGETTTGEQCGGTVCGTCQKCENETCMTADDYEMACTSEGKSGWCVSGTCQPEETCNCGPNQYCADYNTSATQANPGKGCVDLKFKEVEIDGTTYYVSNSEMSWWDAMSFCEALGTRMINQDTVSRHCSYDEVGCNSNGITMNSLAETLYSRVWNSTGHATVWFENLLYGAPGNLSFDNGGGVFNSTLSRHEDRLFAICR